jgi:cytosine deaminase
LDVGISGGRIQAILPEIHDAAEVEVAADGRLVTESFGNPHLHLDKVYTLSRLDERSLRANHGGQMGAAMSAIELAARVKADYQQDWILENVRKALELALKYGNTHIRAFADVDPKAGLKGVRAVMQARDEFRGRIEVQVVSFPQDGLMREPGAGELMRQAMAEGADLVGGIPWIEYTDADARRHIDEMFALAREFDARISMLVDDAGDSGLRTLEMLAVKTRAVGWDGRVLAHHARAMALYPEPYLQKVIALLKAAQIGVVTDPHSGPLHANVEALLAAEVEVCRGQDDISDAYYPFGRNNMLEVAFLASDLLWMTTPGDIGTLYEMITTRAVRAIGLRDFGLREGGPAHLVVLDAEDELEALRDHRKPAVVISHGNLIQ